MSGRRQKAVVEVIQDLGAEVRRLGYRLREAEAREAEREAALTDLRQRVVKLEAWVLEHKQLGWLR